MNGRRAVYISEKGSLSDIFFCHGCRRKDETEKKCEGQNFSDDFPVERLQLIPLFSSGKSLVMHYEALLKDDPVQLVKKLLTELSGKKGVDVRFEFVDNDQWAVVSVYMDEEDNELSLRLHHNGHFELYVGYYDEEDELQELSKTLTSEEIQHIPKSLQKVMGKVVADEEGLRVSGSILVM